MLITTRRVSEFSQTVKVRVEHHVEFLKENNSVGQQNLTSLTLISKLSLVHIKRSGLWRWIQKKEVYMKQAPGFSESFKIKLCSLKDSGKLSLMNACTSTKMKNICLTIVHVDDMIFASNSDSLISAKIAELKSFELKSLGTVKNYLEIKV